MGWLGAFFTGIGITIKVVAEIVVSGSTIVVKSLHIFNTALEEVNQALDNVAEDMRNEQQEKKRSSKSIHAIDNGSRSRAEMKAEIMARTNEANKRLEAFLKEREFREELNRYKKQKPIDVAIQVEEVKSQKPNIENEVLGGPYANLSAHTVIVYKYMYKNIIPYLRSKGITKLYHFTDIRNLEPIIQRGGLYSWKGLQDRNFHAYLASNELSRQLDVQNNLQDYIRLAYVPFHPMTKRVNQTESCTFIWLEIDLEIACWESTLYSDKNATDSTVHVKESFEFLKTLNLDIFRYKYMDLNNENDKKSYQAEVLVKDFLPIKYITNLSKLRQRHL